MVSEDSGGTSAHFDDAIDGFGGAIAGSGRVEVGQECVLPLAQGSAQASDIADETRW